MLLRSGSQSPGLEAFASIAMDCGPELARKIGELQKVPERIRYHGPGFNVTPLPSFGTFYCGVWPQSRLTSTHGQLLIKLAVLRLIRDHHV
jgi:hypothetical protein